MDTAKKFSRNLFCIAVVLIQLSCGGGGGENDPASLAPNPPAEPATIPVQFGDVVPGSTLIRGVTLSNTGTAVMTVQSLPTLPAPFSLVQDNCSSRAVAAGSTCTFSIQFAPSSAGVFNYRFDVPSDAATKTTISMTGNGTTRTGSSGNAVPAAPLGIRATPGDGQVTIVWDNTPDATRYNLFWRTAADVNSVKIADVASPYTHVNLTNSVEYHYFVTAENAIGASNPSLEVIATPTTAAPPLPATDWSATKQFGVPGDDQARAVAIDDEGNVYVVGSTSGSLDGNPYAGGETDAFVVKYNAAGAKQWTRELGTTDRDQAFGAATDTDGNVYVTGQTWGNLDGNAFAGGDGDAFLTKYDSTGLKLWTKTIATTGEDTATSVAVDISGNIYAAGATGTALGSNVFAGGTGDVFVAKYDSTGTQLWLQQFGAGGTDVANGVAVDTAGNVFVAGWTSGALHGVAYIGGMYDAFLVKLDSAGVWLWTNVFGATDGVLGVSSTDLVSGVAVDVNGNVYVGGLTTGIMDGDLTGVNHGLGSMGDAFVAYFDTSGVKQWIRQFGTEFTDSVNAVAADSAGNVYATGPTAGGLGGNSSAGAEDLFITKYDSAGTKQWTRQPGTKLSDSAYGAAVNMSREVFIAGATASDLNGNTNAGPPRFDAFVIKYDTNGGG